MVFNNHNNFCTSTKYCTWSHVNISFLSIFGALIVSISTIKSAGVFYFKTTAIIVCVGTLVFNDYLRFYGSLPQATWAEKIGLYAFYIVICITGFFKAKKYCK
ncbi:hypothetical protein DK924_09095 [Pseudoalteromonas sp. meg-B1]|nr:hypothetical protein DK924_09095 [Pseudoalteromonas sp. meg-B1]